MKLATKIFLAVLSITFFLSACSPGTAEVSYPPPADVIISTQPITNIDPSLILTPMSLTQTLTPAQATSNAPHPT